MVGSFCKGRAHVVIKCEKYSSSLRVCSQVGDLRQQTDFLSHGVNSVFNSTSTQLPQTLSFALVVITGILEQCFLSYVDFRH